MPAQQFSLSLVVPAYNEAARLPAFFASIVAFHREHPLLINEIILVDDGSTDATSDIARQYAAQLPLKLNRFSVNQGKGAAVQAGVKQASGDYIVFIDADGATDISELPKMISALQNSDIAIGNRWLPGSRTERHSLLRRLSGWTYRCYMSLFGLGQIDTMCGFKGYRQRVAQSLFAELIEPRWLFDTEVAYKAVRAGYRIHNFPIHWESKDGSKLSTFTLFQSALGIYPLIAKIKKSSPLN
jgi:glycosyltransferase involved in cell wall biosynthesis